MKQKILKAFDLLFFFIYSRLGGLVMPLRENSVLFLTEARENLDGNLKAMYDYIKENNMNYELLVFSKADRRKREAFGKRLRIYRALTTSKYVFLDDFYGITSSMKVRKNQKLVQLWHGSGAFKRFGFSRVSEGDSLKGVHTGYRKYTDAYVTSEPVRACFAEAFDIDLSKVRAIGSPRTDMFFDITKKAETRKRLESMYPQISGKKLVLIAPTYRGARVQDAGYDFDRLNLDKICDDLGDEYVVAVKWHPAVKNNIKLGKISLSLDDRIIDFTDYDEMNDILVVTDILVTDYSSVIFDYYLLERPVVYFTYDLSNYDGGRGFYFDFSEYQYGKTADNYDDLIKAIKSGDMMIERRKKFGDKFMKACDGKSCEKVAECIFGEGNVDGIN